MQFGLIDEHDKEAEERLHRIKHLESLATLVGGIAHDLNNALAPLRLALDMLPRIKDPKQMNFILATLKSGVERGAAMIRQIQTFAHGDEGDRLSLSIRDVIHDVEARAKQTLPANIEMNVSLASGLWRILGDARRLSQALAALVINAVEAMPQGGKLLIEAGNVSLQDGEAHSRNLKEGNYVYIQVIDSGIGISSAIGEKAIDPFFTTKLHGQGLGLSTAHGIIKSHGGFLEVAGAPNGGVKAKVYLPCQDKPPDTAEPESPLVPDRGNGEEVLVVDRDQPVRTMIAATLSDFGYKPIPLAELSDAEMIPSTLTAGVRVAIVDLDKDGHAGKAKIEALLAQKPRLKIIAMRSVNDGVGERNKLADFFPVLEKPFKAEQLLGAVSLALSQTQLLEMVKAVHAG